MAASLFQHRLDDLSPSIRAAQSGESTFVPETSQSGLARPGARNRMVGTSACISRKARTTKPVAEVVQCGEPISSFAPIRKHVERLDVGGTNIPRSNVAFDTTVLTRRACSCGFSQGTTDRAGRYFGVIFVTLLP